MSTLSRSNCGESPTGAVVRNCGSAGRSRGEVGHIPDKTINYFPDSVSIDLYLYYSKKLLVDLEGFEPGVLVEHT
jgi:hypothetical protein